MLFSYSRNVRKIKSYSSIAGNYDACQGLRINLWHQQEVTDLLWCVCVLQFSAASWFNCNVRRKLKPFNTALFLTPAADASPLKTVCWGRLKFGCQTMSLTLENLRFDNTHEIFLKDLRIVKILWKVIVYWNYCWGALCRPAFPFIL